MHDTLTLLPENVLIFLNFSLSLKLAGFRHVGEQTRASNLPPPFSRVHPAIQSLHRRSLPSSTSTKRYSTLATLTAPRVTRRRKPGRRRSAPAYSAPYRRNRKARIRVKAATRGGRSEAGPMTTMRRWRTARLKLERLGSDHDSRNDARWVPTPFSSPSPRRSRSRTRPLNKMPALQKQRHQQRQRQLAPIALRSRLRQRNRQRINWTRTRTS
jgi:hypothetical protein